MCMPSVSYAMSLRYTAATIRPSASSAGMPAWSSSYRITRLVAIHPKDQLGEGERWRTNSLGYQLP